MEREQNIRNNLDMSTAYRYLRVYREPNPEVVANSIISGLKQEPDEGYGDVFNKLVCTNLDEELATRVEGRDVSGDELLRIAAQELRDELIGKGKKPNLLKWSEEKVRERIQQSLTEDNYREYRNLQREQQTQKLSEEAKTYAERFMEERGVTEIPSQQMSDFETLWVLTNVAQPYPFNEQSVRRSVLEQLASSVFEGNDFTITTFVCMSYVHEPDSKPGTVRVSQGPIEQRDGRDNDDIEALTKFSETAEVFRKFLGDKVRAYAILSDVDFVDVFRVTDPDALREAEQYYENYRNVCRGMNLLPLSFMEMVSANPEARSLYQEAKDDISQNIQKARKSNQVKSPEFYYDLIFINGLTQSIYDYYNSLPGITMSWDTAYQNTVDKLLVYGSQPEVLRTLFPQRFVFISSEVPVRDAMYMPRDKALKRERMPIIYPFSFEEQEK